ncbi:flagellar hook-length control protein FliK [Roseovarius confluentis]|uniref:flagellar hook-length control protein FliK n=1 Tax=Roseovarius confluentis TaxID=1852027 RepID=UPI000CDE4AB1|nr:flagellar hook-length control protein FliK [Roseovarius confluentis]
MFYTVTSETSAAQTNSGNGVRNVPAAEDGKAEGNTHRPSFASVFVEAVPRPSEADSPKQKAKIDLQVEDPDAHTEASGEAIESDSGETDAPVEDEHPTATEAAEESRLVAGVSEAEIEEQNAALKHESLHQDRTALTASLPSKPAIASDGKGEVSWAGNARDHKVEGRNAAPQARHQAPAEPSQNPVRSPDGFGAERDLAQGKGPSDPAGRTSSAAPSPGAAKSAEFLATAGVRPQVGYFAPSADGEFRADEALTRSPTVNSRPENYMLVPQSGDKRPNQAVVISSDQAGEADNTVSRQERDIRSVPNVQNRVGAGTLSQFVVPDGGVAAPPTQSIVKSEPSVGMGRGWSSAVPASDTFARQIAMSKPAAEVQQVPNSEPADYRRLSAAEARTANQGTLQPDLAPAYGSKPVSSPPIVTSAVVPENLDAHSKGEDWARTFEPDSSRMNTVGALTSQVETSAPLRTSLVGLARMPDLPRHVSEQLAAGLRRATEQSAEIRLNPAELGRVRINLHTSDTGVIVSVLADRPETLDLLRRNSDILAQEFREIGYGAAEFSFGQGGDPQTGKKSDADRGSYRHDVAEPDGDATPDVAPLDVSTRIALDRVDIRL